jgi:hypothetical protein
VFTPYDIIGFLKYIFFLFYDYKSLSYIKLLHGGWSNLKFNACIF